MIPTTIDDICDLFDCQVLEDYYDEGGFYLGSVGDYSVGIPSFELTPVLPSKAELEAFCESEEGWEHINEMAAQTFVDWDMENQEWIE